MKHSSFTPAGGAALFTGKYEINNVCSLPSPEGFEIELFSDGSAVLFAATPRAEKYALSQTKKMTGKELPCGKYAFVPEFAVRGIIEGFYGNPWTVDERRRLLSALSDRGMNSYFYGPKDDPFHRDRWDELYGENDADTLKTLISIAGENLMDFRYMLAPGLSIRYSSSEDREKLHAKYAQVMGFGVKKFGLLLDDLESAELYEEDARVYPRQVDAHIDLVNDVYDHITGLDKDASLIVCPTQYWGRTNQEYLTALGRGIRQGCELFYTGPYICSDELTCDFARQFYADTGKKLIWWDNYPVNDMEMVDELHLRPVSGREKGLGACCEGLVSNPMELAESSLVPLLTVADYLWNSSAYDPAESRSEALAQVCPGYEKEVCVLSELCYKSCLEREGHHFEFVRPRGENPDFERALSAGAYPLWQYLSFCLTSLEKLSRSGLKLVRECERWINTAKIFCRGGIALLERGEGELLRAYLYENEDIMKREARRLLDIFEKQSKI